MQSRIIWIFKREKINFPLFKLYFDTFSTDEEIKWLFESREVESGLNDFPIQLERRNFTSFRLLLSSCKEFNETSVDAFQYAVPNGATEKVKKSFLTFFCRCPARRKIDLRVDNWVCSGIRKKAPCEERALRIEVRQTEEAFWPLSLINRTKMSGQDWMQRS